MWPAPSFLHLPGPVKRVAIYDTGASPGKPAILFVHGLAIHGGIWKYLFDKLSPEFRCIAIDLPGHGLSWNERGSFTISFYAQTLRSCIEALQPGEITLAGHSMGGQICIAAALQMPALVRRLVLVCSAGIETFTAEEGNKIIQGAEYVYRMPMEAAQLLAVYQPHLGRHTERLSDLMDNHARLQREHFNFFSETVIQSVKGMINEPVFRFLPQLQTKTLALFGADDKLIPNRWVHPMMQISDVAGQAKKQIPAAEVKVLPDCGHYLPMENAEALAGEIRKIVK